VQGDGVAPDVHVHIKLTQHLCGAAVVAAAAAAAAAGGGKAAAEQQQQQQQQQLEGQPKLTKITQGVRIHDTVAGAVLHTMMMVQGRHDDCAVAATCFTCTVTRAIDGRS
jgi:hypothetical protein